MTRATFLIFFFLFTSIHVNAAEIEKIAKDGRILIDPKGDSLKVGDQLNAVNSSGKIKAIIEVSSLLKSGKAVGKNSRGKPAAGMTLKPRLAKGEKKASKTASGHPKDRAYWGAMFGYAQDSMKVKTVFGNTTEDVSLSGSGFSAKALFDYEIFPQLWFRGTSGIEMFNATGPSRCGIGRNTVCEVKITYVTFDGLARYVFSTGKFRPWLGGGFGILFPAATTTSALDEASVTTINVFTFAGGADVFISKNMYLPFTVEYGLLSKSDTVSHNWIAFRAGLALAF